MTDLLLTSSDRELLALCEKAPSVVCDMPPDECPHRAAEVATPARIRALLISLGKTRAALREETDQHEAFFMQHAHPNRADADLCEWQRIHEEGIARARSLLSDLAVGEADGLAVQEDDMCPNCVTPWKCNGPHATRYRSSSPAAPATGGTSGKGDAILSSDRGGHA